MKQKQEVSYQRLQIRSEESLIFSSPQSVQFPIEKQIKRGFFNSVTSFIKQSDKPKIIKRFLPIPNQLILLANGNVIRMYKYWQTSDEELHIQLHTELQLSYYIKDIKVSPLHKCPKDKEFYLIAQSLNSTILQLLHYQSINQRINKIKQQKVSSQIKCWTFVEHKQILVWCMDMKVYHYEIKHQNLKLIQIVDVGINLNEQLKIADQQQYKARSKSKKKQKSSGDAKSQIENQKINHFQFIYCTILGRKGKQQDSTIVLFYVLYNQQQHWMKVKCKQILYPLQNQDPYTSHIRYSEFPKLKAMPQTFQIISNNLTKPQLLKNLNIVQIDDVYMIHFEFEIIAIQKKFDQYYVMDNVYKKSKQSKVSKVQMAFNANLLACISGNILELNQIQINDNKIHTVLTDFIDLQSKDEEKQKINEEVVITSMKKLRSLMEDGMPQKKSFEQLIKNNEPIDMQLLQAYKIRNLYSMWVTVDPYNEQHRSNICFLFEVTRYYKDKKRSYELFITKHIPLIKKLTKLGHNAKQLGQLENIQRLGQNLGLNYSEFYYNMWRTSTQGSEQILSYLLKCKNYEKILIQLRGFMRKKSFPIAKLLKVLQKLQTLTLQIAKEKLTQQFLIDYFHTIFVHRKFQIYESNYQIDERQFVQTLEISLYDIVRKIINNTLFPESKKSSLWMMQQKQQPKLNIIQVLDLFKLPLLQQYDEFLKKVLQQYPDQIIQVIDRFPELLPNYPFSKYHIVERNSLLDVLQTIKCTKQKEFFSPIKKEDLFAEPNYLMNTLKELYPFYSTSLISKHFEQAMSKPDMREKKFYFHSIIESDFELYQQKIERINATNLYIVVLECLVMAAFAKDKPSNIKALCQKMYEHYGIQKAVMQDLQIATSLFQLMIKYSIVNPSEVHLKQVFEQPIEKWIALFFLGNKQQKDLIFTEFTKIFPEKQRFVQALRKFISSQHCSKIELSFLIDLITHISEQFQKQNQKIINVIVDGFCSRVEISDTPDSNHFIDRIRSIQLGPQLLIKVDKIEKMKLCRRIFGIFYMEDILVKDLMDRTDEVLEQMLENFFMNKIKQSKISISQKKYIGIDNNNVSSMFELMNYLRENIFFNLTSEKMLIIYCKKLLQWQSFEEIETLLYQSKFIENEGLSLTIILPKIQLSILQQIYSNNDTFYDEQTLEYIDKILKLQRKPETNIVVIQERAKIALSQIFKKFGHDKKLSEINQLINQWQLVEEEVNRQAAYGEILCRSVMSKIIDDYEDYLDANSLEQIYKYFMITSTCKDNLEIRTDEFYHYCTKLAGNLLEIGRLRVASQIICIANQRFEMNYWLMTECLLNSLNEVYINKNLNSREVSVKDSSISQGFSEMLFKHEQIYTKERDTVSVGSEQMNSQTDYRKLPKNYIDYFVLNWVDKDEEAMRKIFSCFFQDTLESEQELLVQFEVNTQISFRQHRHKITSSFLWNIVEDICDVQKINKNQLIFCYFFLRMGLAEPKIGFAQIDYISYNQSILFMVLNKFKQKCDVMEELNFIDYSIIFKLYLDAITELLTTLHQDDSQLNQTNLSRDKSDSVSGKSEELLLSPQVRGKPNLGVVRELVKKGLYKEDPLSSIINKMATLTIDAIKHSKKREVSYITLIDTKKLETNPSHRQNNLFRKLQKIQQNLQSDYSQKGDDLKSINEKLAMMSFDQFKKMKHKIKNDKTLSITVGPDLNLTERVIVQEIFDQMDVDSSKLGSFNDKNKKLIPGLEELILTSIKQLEDEKNQKKQQKQHSTPIYHPTLKDSNLNIGQYQQDQQVLIESINLQNYSLICNWSSDAILIVTAKVYDSAQVKFSKVIKMFHELCVGNSNKIDVLCIAESQSLNTNNMGIKKIFNIESLRHDFPVFYNEFQEVILNKVYLFIADMNNQQICSLGRYLKDISKIQYKKAVDWTNMLAMLEKSKNQGKVQREKIQRFDEQKREQKKINLFNGQNGKNTIYHIQVKNKEFKNGNL